MVFIAICDPDEKSSNILELDIHKQLLQKRIGLSFTYYSNYQDIPSELKYDVYFTRVETDRDFEEVKKIRQYNQNCFIVIISSSDKYSLQSYDIDCLGYLVQPIDRDRLNHVIDKGYRIMRHKVVSIITSAGLRRVEAKMINYINIERRNICYHMSDGELINGQTMRTSFAKTVGEAVLLNDDYKFLKPSLIVNLDQIKNRKNNKIEFLNGDIIYLSKSQVSEFE